MDLAQIFRPCRVYLVLILALNVALSVACEPIDGTVLEGGESYPPAGAGGGSPPTSGKWMPTNDPPPEVSDAMLSTALLFRATPNTAITEITDRYDFCTAVPISETLVVVPAKCVLRGVAYGELFTGDVIDFNQSPRAVSRVKRIYTHPDYEAQTSTDIALMVVEPALTSSFAIFSSLSSARVSAFVRVGYTASADEKRFERVSKVIELTTEYPTELLFGLGAAESCKVPGGGTLFPTSEAGVGVIGINARGGEDCTQSGVTIRLDANRSFLKGSMNIPSLPGGYSGELTPSLTCGQSLNCGDDTICQGQIHPDHTSVRDELFRCMVDNAPCPQPDCYQVTCFDEVQACLNAPSLPNPLSPPSPAGVEVGPVGGGVGAEMAGATAGGEGGEGGASMLGGAAAGAGVSAGAQGGM